LSIGQGSRSKEHDPRMGPGVRLRERRGQLVDFGLPRRLYPTAATLLADADATPIREAGASLRDLGGEIDKRSVATKGAAGLPIRYVREDLNHRASAGTKKVPA